MAGLRNRSQDYALLDAQHSRLGELGSAFVANGGGVEMTVGDTLTLVYRAAETGLPGAASWYLLVRRVSDSGGSSTPLRRRLGARPPRAFALHANQPNPFRGTTVIPFDLPVETPVRLEVFDLLGRRVATLADATYPAGSHAMEWDMRDAAGGTVWPGVYVYRMSAGEFRAKRKMSVLP